MKGIIKINTQYLYSLARAMKYDEFEQELKHLITKLPITQVILGDVVIEVSLSSVKPKLSPNDFKHFTEVATLFNRKFYNEKAWLECYDKLTRIDGYSEDSI
jgi:hypothetical protein